MTEEIVKQPVLVEIIGEPEVGKTHTSLFFPDPYLADTSPKKKSRQVVMKVFPDEWRKRYAHVQSFKELRDALKLAIERGRKTFIVDTSADLRTPIGVNEYLKAHTEKSAVYPPSEWKWVNLRVMEIINAVFEAEMNLVFTADMKDQWISKKRTGIRERDGFPKMPFHCDIRLYLTLQEETDEAGLHKGWKRKCKVVKNAFVDKASDEWVSYLEEISWEKIMEMTKLPRERWVE